MAQNSAAAKAAIAAITPMAGSQSIPCCCNRVCICCPSCGYKLGSQFRVCNCSRVCNYCWNCGCNLVDYQQHPLTPSIETDVTMDDSRVLYLYSSATELNEWYRVDLEHLPEKLSPLVKRSYKPVGFTVIGDYLYCNGGLSQTLDRSISKSLFICNTTNPNPEWTKVLCDYPLGYEPFMFSFDSKIYIMRGNRNPPFTEEDKSVSQTYWVRVFNLNSGNWEKVEPIPDFVHSVPALKDESTDVLFSLQTGAMYFYNAIENSWRFTLPDPSLVLGENHVPSGLEGCNYIPLLQKLLLDRAPLVRDLTMYWFSNDLRLYGYDTVQKRWLVSNRIKRKLLTLGREFLPLPLNPYDFDDTSTLTHLSDGKFLLLVPLAAAHTHEFTPFLAMATLAVDKKAGALNVSLEKCHIVPTHHLFRLSSGMTM